LCAGDHRRELIGSPRVVGWRTSPKTALSCRIVCRCGVFREWGTEETEETMLANKDATAMVAVKNLATAKKFYEGTLGLKQLETEGDEVITYGSGESRINVYRSQYAGTNKATTLTWTVDDVDGEVRALKSKGVSFEHYDMPGLKQEGDVYVADGMKVAWFKDPDGNILSIVSN
jgi:catechol 2,3-dioxygenase-like lactoylglutathione lyase family enzyme